jgi:exopolysaccharide biosynthesis polyprenyl glycosylphosphotransferase
MSSLLSNPSVHQPSGTEWARLIPGEAPDFRPGKKNPARAVAPATAHPGGLREIAPPSFPARTITLANLLPAPFQSRHAWNWFRSVTADFALVTLNWLLIGALLVPLRSAFPRVRLFSYAAGSPVALVGIAVLHASLITLMAYIERLYSSERACARSALVLAKAVAWATLVLTVACRLEGAPWTRSILLVAAAGLHFAVLWLRRRLQFSEQGAQQRSNARHTLIFGSSSTARRLARALNSGLEEPRLVCGLVDDRKPLGSGIVGRTSDLPRLARTLFVDEVILAAPQDRNLTLHLLREAQRLRLDVSIAPELFGCIPKAAEVETAGDLPLICLHAEQMPAAALLIKRLVDVIASSLALLALSPAMALIAALIKLDSHGPVFYSAERAGKKGRPFRCHKFRTMVANADALKHDLRSRNQRSGPFFKIADDPRITRAGRILRRFSLDELPQFWNVLKGDVSMVGPRPHPLDDFAVYETQHLARLDATPGITGLWQVTARRDPSFERGMELDREYIRRWSLRLDAQILLKTLFAVLRGGGD